MMNRLVCLCLIMLLTACTVQTDPIAVTRVVETAVATPTIPTATMLPVTTTAVAATPTAIPAPTASLDEASGRWLSAINPVTIYSGSASDYAPAGVLEVGSTAKVLGNIQGDAIPIACLDDALDTCWVVWDYNALYPYEGTPLTLEIPDPASLTMASTDTAVSPDGRWQTEITRSETVLLAGDAAEFFYVEMKIISLADDRHWQPVGEWHAAGLGEEGTPRPFHWSADGRYFYYTNTFDYHGGCAVYDNIGDHLNRLDLTNGLVTSLPSPLARGILTLSPDERFMAYLSGQSLVIRELATAYDDNDTAQESVIWQIPFELAWQGQVNQIAWSADGQKVLLSVDHRLNDCAINGSSSWELDVETGVLTATTVFVPTPTPVLPAVTSTTAVTPHNIFPVIETDAAYVISQRGDQIYSGPGFEYDTIGVLFEAETAVVTGKSEDGEWWRILCSDGTVGSCWLTASPLSTQATEFATLAEMLPDPATLPLDWEMTVMSPDGRWQASTAWTETIQEIGRPFGYATLTVSDGTTTWFPISEWRQFGSSHAIIQWSGDGRYLYYTNATDAEGCYYYISGTDLYRLDVTDGTITTILREFESLNFALSPDNTTLVYTISDQPVLVRRDLATGMEKSVALTQDDAYALKGKIYWLADGVTAVLTLIHDVCFVDETETSSLLRVHTDTLTVTALVDHDDRLLRIWDWPDPDQPQIRLSDKEGSTWWLDVTSFELRQEE